MEQSLEEHRKAQRKAYYEANKEALNAKNKEYRDKKKEEINKRRKEYRQNNKNKIAERDKQYRLKNKDKYRAKSAEWYKANKDRAKNYHFLRRYNISLDDYNRMVIEQDGKCWTCSVKAEDEVLVVDHNHLTGEVRGLLCHKCNTGLGLFRDNQGYLLKAVEYLRKFSEPLDA